VYTCAALLGLTSGVTLGGVALATMGPHGGGVLGVVGAALTVLLSYRALRVRRATDPESA
jgi:hypothetical protein